MSLSAPFMAENRYALVVGDAAYENIPELKNSLADAEAYAETFADLDYEVTYLHNLNRSCMEFALADVLGRIRPVRILHR